MYYYRNLLDALLKPDIDPCDFGLLAKFSQA
jgi:hypothetical protein